MAIARPDRVIRFDDIPSDVHDQEGGQRRHRQLDRDQHRRPQVAHEEEQHQHHQHRALEQGR